MKHHNRSHRSQAAHPGRDVRREWAARGSLWTLLGLPGFLLAAGVGFVVGNQFRGEGGGVILAAVLGLPLVAYCWSRAHRCPACGHLSLLNPGHGGRCVRCGARLK